MRKYRQKAPGNRVVEAAKFEGWDESLDRKELHKFLQGESWWLEKDQLVIDYDNCVIGVLPNSWLVRGIAPLLIPFAEEDFLREFEEVKETSSKVRFRHKGVEYEKEVAVVEEIEDV